MSVLGGLACKKNEHLCIILMNYGRKLSKITSICKKNKVFCSKICSIQKKVVPLRDFSC